MGKITNQELSNDIQVGSLAALNTTTKTDIVSAINEVKSEANVIKNSEGMANGVATTDANNKVVQTANQSDKLSIARTISLNGDVTGFAIFDGSSNEVITVTLANSGATAGTYSKVTIDTKGRVTAGSGLASTDVTNALGFTPLSTTAQAADSAKLNGQPSNYYASASSVINGYEFTVAYWQNPSNYEPINAQSPGSTYGTPLQVNRVSSQVTYIVEMDVSPSGATWDLQLKDLTNSTYQDLFTYTASGIIRSAPVSLTASHQYGIYVQSGNQSYANNIFMARIVGQI